MDSEDPMIFRVGIFFYVIGGGAFILFVTSDLAEQADFDFLFVSLLMMGIGWMLRRGKAPPPSAGRFAWLNKQREERRKKKQGNQEAKKK
jgi:hypothetical protein